MRFLNLSTTAILLQWHGKLESLSWLLLACYIRRVKLTREFPRKRLMAKQDQLRRQ